MRPSHTELPRFSKLLTIYNPGRDYPAMSDFTAAIPTIAQLRENSLSGVVRHEIERLILSGELPTGSRVNENAIALRLGVSRGPIREACSALSATRSC